VVVGVPGQIVTRSKPEPKPDLDHEQMPDAIAALMERVAQLEQQTPEYLMAPLIPQHNGHWSSEDFSI
jgi:hypothetical protein